MVLDMEIQTPYMILDMVSKIRQKDSFVLRNITHARLETCTMSMLNAQYQTQKQVFHCVLTYLCKFLYVSFVCVLLYSTLQNTSKISYHISAHYYAKLLGRNVRKFSAFPTQFLESSKYVCSLL